jgi:hypothetical protein
METALSICKESENLAIRRAPENDLSAPSIFAPVHALTYDVQGENITLYVNRQVIFTGKVGEVDVDGTVLTVATAWEVLNALTDVDGDKYVELPLESPDTAHFKWGRKYDAGRFYGCRQADGRYLGYVVFDAKVTVTHGFGDETILWLPEGWLVARETRPFADVVGADTWRLWSEARTNSRALINVYDNNPNIPEGVEVRMVYHFPCIVRKVST